jgi:hypothetical protein
MRRSRRQRRRICYSLDLLAGESKMNWDAIATSAEVIGALGVIASLIYVAKQVRSSQATAADTNRLTRSAGVREMLHSYAVNDDLRRSVIAANGLESFYEQMASKFDISVDDAARNDFSNAYWFWLHWGQYSSTTDSEDLSELKNVLVSYVMLPAMKYSWDNSFFAQPMLDKGFVEFVEAALADHLPEKEIKQ